MERNARPEVVEHRRQYNSDRYDRESQVERVMEWRRRNPDAARRIQRKAQAKRRALIKGSAVVDAVDYVTVFERDGGHCGICGSKVHLVDGSIDHIIPLSEGGDHSYVNVQLAHKTCNSSKGNRRLHGGEQLRLIG